MTDERPDEADLYECPKCHRVFTLVEMNCRGLRERGCPVCGNELTFMKVCDD